MRLIIMKKAVLRSSTRFICFLILAFSLNLSSVQPVFAQDDAQLLVAEKLNNKRKSFYIKKKTLVAQHQAEMQPLEREIASLKQQKTYEDYSDRLASNLVAKGFANSVRAILFPPMVFNIFFGKNVTLYLLFLLTIINSIIFLYYQERDFFIQKKKLIYITAATLFILFASPGFAHASEQTDVLYNKISETEKIIKLSHLKREIHILESYQKKPGLQVEIAKLNIKNPDLQPLETVKTGQWSYYYTLAALYIEDEQPGKADDNLNIMFAKLDKKSTPLQIDSVKKSINYLIKKNQYEVASKAVDKFLPTITETGALLDLTEQLYQHDMVDSVREALDRAIKIAKDETALLQLCKYFIKKGKHNDAAQSLSKAISKTQSREKLLELIKFAASHQMGDALNQGIEKMPKMSPSLEDYFQLSDYLLGHQRVEQSSKIITMGIDNISIRKRQKNYIDSYLKAVRLASARENYTQAVTATERLYRYLGNNVSSFKVPLSNVSINREYLPTNEAISLPTFYGSLQQESGFADRAEEAYIEAVTQLSNQAQETFRLETGLNDLFYLWQFYKAKEDYQTLEKLDTIYSLLEEQNLQRLHLDHQQRMRDLTKEVATLKENQVITTNQKKYTGLLYSTITHILSGLSTICLLALLLYYCYKNARLYSQQSLVLKTYAFGIKFIENIGWSYCMTIVGFVYGIIIVFISQFFQIGHQQLGVSLRKEKLAMERDVT